MTSLHFGTEDFWMPVYCFRSSKMFCKTLDGASNATKMTQIDKGLNKIFILK
jgi:hypothetical protein